MRTEKVRFITGAITGATVNFAIQSVKMAMDYDRPFDWNEFFLCAGAGAFAANLKGIASIARPTFGNPGLASLRAYPGFAASEFRYPERVASTARGSTLRHLLHSLISAGLIAYAISRNHTLKFSRTTRLFLWAFGISYLGRITLDSAATTRSPKPATFNFQPSTLNLL